MKITLKITGTSPLLMHNPQMVDPEFSMNREIKLLTSKRKKTDEDFKKIEELEWYGGLYEQNGVIIQPTSKPRKCIINAGRISKQGKHIERALSFSALHVPLEHDGPDKIGDVYADKRFTSRLSVGINGKRIMRVRPCFPVWALTLEGMLLESVMNLDEFENICEIAGLAEGIGDNRVNGYGRFAVKVTQHA